ncbi:hypothetical protein HNR46_000842 [Haloferula luteola]|uniref:Uncharacterized protein n=1 Tax=Haloferula luteola TaxID=595692 RepID=A0A840V4Q4_9BACT|nr:hypothetical protein [Haloferula luteola]
MPPLRPVEGKTPFLRGAEVTSAATLTDFPQAQAPRISEISARLIMAL